MSASSLPVPPWLVRRVLIAPLMPLLALVALVGLPLVAAGSAVVALGGNARWRALRVWWFALTYLTLETVGVVACLGTWLASGAGWRLRSPRFRAAHLALLTWFLSVLLRTAVRTFRFRLVLDEPGPHGYGVPDLTARDEPLIILGRHAGPGASFVLVELLLSRYHRSPLVVLKRDLRLDPALDLLLTRLSAAFISAAPGAGEAATSAISELAASMEAGDALVLFPEGGNYSPRRHRRSVRRLRDRGLTEQADKAADLRNVLPPRPAGALAALTAAPTAQTVVFTHTGLDDLTSAPAIWRALPLDRAMHMAWWHTSAGEIPRGDPDELADWLLGQWGQVDTWIAEQSLLADVVKAVGGNDAAPAEPGRAQPAEPRRAQPAEPERAEPPEPERAEPPEPERAEPV